MNNQLDLITAPRSWRLDRQTRQRGLDGVAAARAVLHAARARDRVVDLVGAEAVEPVADAA
jgi:hypothetical protein